MTTFNGMDTTQGDAFGQSLQERRARLSDLLAHVSRQVRGSETIWQGPDADTFRADGEEVRTGVMEPALERLSSIADEMRLHVEEQEEASAAGGQDSGTGEESASPDAAMAEDPSRLDDINNAAEYGIVDAKVAEAWKNMSDEDRRKVAQEMVNQELERYGLPPQDIAWKKMQANGSHRAPFLGLFGQIALNPDRLSDPRILHTIAHEVRHAAQHKAVEYTEWDLWDWETDTEYREMAEDYGITREEIEAWRDNRGLGYKGSPNAPAKPEPGASVEEKARYEEKYAEYEREYLEYFNQPVEKDARKSGKEFSESLTMDELRRYQRDAGVPESKG